MEQYRDADPTPLASALLDLAALNHEIAALRRDQLALEIRTFDAQARTLRLTGALSDLVQRIELKAGKRNAAPVAPEAA